MKYMHMVNVKLVATILCKCIHEYMLPKQVFFTLLIFRICVSQPGSYTTKKYICLHFYRCCRTYHGIELFLQQNNISHSLPDRELIMRDIIIILLKKMIRNYVHINNKYKIHMK